MFLEYVFLSVIYVIRRHHFYENNNCNIGYIISITCLLLSYLIVLTQIMLLKYLQPKGRQASTESIQMVFCSYFKTRTLLLLYLL